MNFIAKILMNSLYGRFGLNPILPENILIDKNDLDDFIDTSEINELIEFDNKFIFSYLNKNKIENSLTSSVANDFDIKSNVAIASAITAYSRVVLSKIKKYCFDNNIKLYYFDTDSIFVDKTLPDLMVGKEIGLWKLEAKIKEGVFIAPKVYGYITVDNNEIVKCKGFKNKLSFTELKSLLIKDNKLELNQVKWFKSLKDSNITIKNQLYTLIPTSNKRNLIYKNNKKERKSPFKINT
jgi:DNA polymerase elongation subunit (family B)